MPTSEKIVKGLMKTAKEKGAANARLISTKDVFIEDYVRLKCKYGCKMYARCFTCPPYAPTPDETRKMLKNYSRALLIEFAGMKDEADQRKAHEIMFEVEREAFLNGLYKAFVYVSGPCRFCVICPAYNIRDRNEFSKKECRYPLKAKPSMEACGIDVYKTARKAGLKVDVVRGGEPYKSFILMLLE